VYLAVLSKDVPAAVRLSLELFGGECGATTRVCPNPDEVGKACGREPFPAIDHSSKPLGAGKYIVAVRAPKEVVGQWSLFYQHIPITCVDGREVLMPGRTLQENTCQRGDNYVPSCGPTSGVDVSHVVLKCPNHQLAFRACADPGKAPPLVLSALWTSMRAEAASGRCTPIGNARLDQCGLAPGTSCETPAVVGITSSIPGMVMVSVDSTVVVGALACGGYALQYQTAAAN
jgi:hypothetical protein